MILLRSARQLVTLRGPAPRRGFQHSDLEIIQDGSVLIDQGSIVDVGPTRRIENLGRARGAQLIDVSGKVVLPGWVDSHLRLSFASPALTSFEQRISGAAPSATDELRQYPRSTIRSFSREDLRGRLRRWMFMAAMSGTTSVEIRSRQGLESADELKALRVAYSIDGDPIETAAVYVASAPAPPLRCDAEEISSRAEAIVQRARQPPRLISTCAVECGPEALEPELCRRILEYARERGCALKVQGDRFERSGAAQLAVEMAARSADHLTYLDERDIDLLARSSTIATLMPGVTYHQGGERFAPARLLIDRGAAVALATGFGGDEGPSLSMSVALALACREMRLMPEEAIAAATINGACAMGRQRTIGSIEPGKQADLAVFDISDYREIPFFLGMNLCILTMKQGRIVSRTRAPGSGLPAPRASRRAPTR